jgi:polyhydroxyalkanoate synthase
VADAAVTLSELKVPAFVVATETDHVAPWKSVFKLHQLTDVPLTFVLTSGGHNAGVVSPPGQPNRRYRIATRDAHGRSEDADSWAAEAPLHEGSWWPSWTAWLAGHSGPPGPPVAPPAASAAIGAAETLPDAPGTYVIQT